LELSSIWCQANRNQTHSDNRVFVSLNVELIHTFTSLNMGSHDCPWTWHFFVIGRAHSVSRSVLESKGSMIVFTEHPPLASFSSGNPRRLGRLVLCRFRLPAQSACQCSCYLGYDVE
jgi:hypothetical protein